jgi:DtxR family transcriptional regulator, Mn-dependent transcriptional regulator
MEVDDLSAVAQDYLKVIWSASEWGEAPITTTGLAGRFATTAANVSVTLRRLQSQGLVDYQPYRPAGLTPLGRSLAVAMVRRHRLLETFLASELGYAWDEVHDEAERLEHAVSDELLARIDERLDHPLLDPHGDPIPGRDGSVAPLPATAALSDAGPGEHRVARVSDADAVRLARLARLGVIPGATVSLGVEGPTVLVGREAVELSAEERASVRVFHRSS